ncbi:DNA/RNA helicase, DEAD/DEAH box type, N-terminal [Artemisia annua]|uniref:DNA/RNA helicase, DEAD/DEAH box type, N-terminal n=1 Tax=Artemisia annua TaxID=35608 RepID=A0A2U1K9W6_ARTAN|nr:DNA/RNA helicase, DEAD/DEAH box type, N-terminal [Artemisia annua]
MNSLIRSSSTKLTALASLQHIIFRPILISSSQSLFPNTPQTFINSSYVNRVSSTSSFHTTPWFNVRASAVVTQSAGVAFAAETCSDEDDSVSDGLEVSKLGISQEIVNALAKKGITKLFPIQIKGGYLLGWARIGAVNRAGKEDRKLNEKNAT